MSGPEPIPILESDQSYLCLEELQIVGLRASVTSPGSEGAYAAGFPPSKASACRIGKSHELFIF